MTKVQSVSINVHLGQRWQTQRPLFRRPCVDRGEQIEYAVLIMAPIIIRLPFELGRCYANIGMFACESTMLSPAASRNNPVLQRADGSSIDLKENSKS